MTPPRAAWPSGSSPDYDQIAGYALEAMTWAVEAGVLTGTSSDTLAPGQAATRVQTAQALLALSQIAE